MYTSPSQVMKHFILSNKTEILVEFPYVSDTIFFWGGWSVVLRIMACQDWVESIVRWDENRRSPVKTTRHPQAGLGLSHMWQELSSNPQRWDEKWLRVLKISVLNHSAMGMTFSCKETCWPPHDKTNKMARAPSEDSDQPGHLPSLIRVFAVRSMGG